VLILPNVEEIGKYLIKRANLVVKTVSLFFWYSYNKVNI
jgi:hypothetical protein